MRIAVIGAGASGLVAAGSAADAEVVMFEHSEKAGKKLYITGKGRCNFTNVCDVKTFLCNVVTNPNFLRGALYGFTPDDAVALMEKHGCKTKVERGRRAFPLSDKASDIIKALKAYAENNGASIRLNADVLDINKSGDKFFVITPDGSESFDKVIMCTGGLSYPSTGSDGSAYRIIKAFGHNITEQKPSLVGLYTKEDVRSAQGLTLKNVTVAADGIKPIFGDMLITEDGLSGPIALTLSAYAAHKMLPYTVTVDLKPTVSRETLDNDFLRLFDANKNKQLKNVLGELLPHSMAELVTVQSGIPLGTVINAVTKAQRASLVSAVKALRFTVVATEGYERAVVTSGGVDVREVDSKTMMSKLVQGLYFAGEVLDVDALTGGYNIHIALATGFAAGKNAAYA